MGNKGQIAGILSIVSGAFGLLYAALIIILAVVFGVLMQTSLETDTTIPYGFESMGTMFGLIYGIMGIGMALIAILGIVGGAYSIKKKYWGLGLAGAIAGAITFFPCGIAAIIVIALGKEEFDRPVVASSPVVQPPFQP